MTPGDFILVERRGLVSAMIRLGQRIRPSQRPWARWSHAAFIVSEQGDLVEALTRGVTRSRLEDYAETEHVLVATGLDEHDQAQAVAFAESCVGQSYGFLVILGIALRFLTPGRGLWFGMNGTEICSGLCAHRTDRLRFVSDHRDERRNLGHLIEERRRTRRPRAVPLFVPPRGIEPLVPECDSEARTTPCRIRSGV